MIAGIITEKGVIRPVDARAIPEVLGAGRRCFYVNRSTSKTVRTFSGGTMADEGPSLDEVRLRLIELIKAHEWRVARHLVALATAAGIMLVVPVAAPARAGGRPAPEGPGEPGRIA